MVTTENWILMIYNAIIAALASIVFVIACLKQKNLRSWLFSYISLTIGNFLYLLQLEHFIFYLSALLFWSLGTICLFIAAFIEYSKIFIKPNNQKLTMGNKLTILFIISPLILGMEVFMLILDLLGIFMLTRIYMKTRSITRGFFLMGAIGILISLLAALIQDFATKDADLVSYFGYLFASLFITLMLSAGFVALLEKKFMDTLNEKNSLKDKYSHDLGNILHAISMTYDLSKMDHASEIKSDELDELINVKINEASKLVKEIRNL